MKREYPDRPILAVAAVVFNTQNCVLLVRRGKNPGKGSWGIPGGAVELGEDLESAVKRELMEETGIAVEPIEKITILDRVHRDHKDRVRYHYVILEYLCRADNARPKAGDDAEKAMWVNLEDTKEFPLTDITREVINQGWKRFASLM
ncbi:NUDIX hydrolase [Thermodesulfobacteriota bacterium]